MTDELFAEHKEDLPIEWHDTFDALTAQGKSPTGIKAAIEYVTTRNTQQEVAQEYGTSEVTIRKLQTAVVALGPIDRAKEGAHGGGQMSSLEFCNYIADVLGWEEGVEYSIRDGGYNGMYSSQSPALLKAGWEDLYEYFSDADHGEASE